MDFEQCCTECLKNDDLVNEFCRLRGIKHPDKRSPIEEVLEKYIQSFDIVEEYFCLNNMTKEEFNKILEEMKLPANQCKHIRT